MGKEFFDYDPLSGVRYDTEQDGDITILHRTQDVQPLIDRNQAMAREGVMDKGIKEGWWHYCDIPPVVELELRKKGIDIHNPEDGKRMFEEINKNYPYLKRTHKSHVGK
jgi:hypothetical protein